MLDLFFPPKPPKPKFVSFVRDEMKNECRDHKLTPEERYQKKLEDMREYSRQRRAQS